MIADCRFRLACSSIQFRSRNLPIGNRKSSIGNGLMWDSKRQFIWLAAGIVLGTWVAFSDSHDEDGSFVPSFFIFMESLVLIIIAVLFYIYSRKKS
jgi:hypothetical protein